MNKYAIVIENDVGRIMNRLMSIPEVRSLIEQTASSFVDKIIVTNPITDIQQTQQKLQDKNIKLQQIPGSPYGHVWIQEDPHTHQKKPLDKIIRIDKITNDYNMLVSILHETLHLRHPNNSEAQVQSEAENLAGRVRQFIGDKNAVAQKQIIFVKQGLHSIVPIKVEIADTYASKLRGLQDHSSLGLDAGMVFPYIRPTSLSYHMASVSFPIDIIFTNNGEIVKICRNCKPGSQEIYSCGNADGVIEVAANFCAFHVIDAGDRIFYADDNNGSVSFIQHIMERIRDMKLEQQKDLDMTDWSIKVVMLKHPRNRFLTIDWDDKDYAHKKAEIIVNPDQNLIVNELKRMPLKKLVRHALLHNLAGAKRELDDDKEYELITSKMLKEAGQKKFAALLDRYVPTISTNNKHKV